jgi:translation elongation factor EF-Tu-like GTPase
MGWFSRRRDRPQDPQQVIDEMAAAHASGADPAMAMGDFALTVQDVFTISGRGTVVTGQVATGQLSVGQQVTQLRDGSALRQLGITGIEMFRKHTDIARTGDTVGLLVSGVQREEIQPGDQLVRPGG